MEGEFGKVNKCGVLLIFKMVDVEFVGQLVDSMEDAILRLEQAIEAGKVDEENKLRVYIFDLHKQISVAIEKEGGEIEKKRVRKKKIKRKRKRSRRKNV